MKKEDVSKEGLVKLVLAIIEDEKSGLNYSYNSSKKYVRKHDVRVAKTEEDYNILSSVENLNFCRKTYFKKEVVLSPFSNYWWSSSAFYSMKKDGNTDKKIFDNSEIFDNENQVTEEFCQYNLTIKKPGVLPIEIVSTLNYKNDTEEVVNKTRMAEKKYGFFGIFDETVEEKYAFKILVREIDRVKTVISYNGFSFELAEECKNIFGTIDQIVDDIKKKEEANKCKKELKDLETAMKKYKVL
jgi:hypothetical protein